MQRPLEKGGGVDRLKNAGLATPQLFKQLIPALDIGPLPTAVDKHIAMRGRAKPCQLKSLRRLLEVKPGTKAYMFELFRQFPGCFVQGWLFYLAHRPQLFLICLTHARWQAVTEAFNNRMLLRLDRLLAGLDILDQPLNFSIRVAPQLLQ